jgi:ferredoxin
MPGSALTPLDRSGAKADQARFGTLQVWVDQDLCTGDGICVDYCPEVFVLLEDGIAYVRESGTVMNDPGCAESPARVQLVHEAAVMSAAVDCPGECIFIETVDDDPAPAERAPGAGPSR